MRSLSKTFRRLRNGVAGSVFLALASIAAGITPTVAEASPHDSISENRPDFGNARFIPGSRWYYVNRDIPGAVVVQVEEKIGQKLCKYEESPGVWRTNLMPCPPDHPQMEDISIGMVNPRLRARPGIEGFFQSIGNYMQRNWALDNMIATHEHVPLARLIDRTYEAYMANPRNGVRVATRMPTNLLPVHAEELPAQPRVRTVERRVRPVLTAEQRRAVTDRLLASLDIKTDGMGVSYVERYGQRYDLHTSADGLTVVASNETLGRMRLTFGDRGAGERANRIYWRSNGVPAQSTLVAYNATPAEPDIRVAEQDAVPFIPAHYTFGPGLDLTAASWAMPGTMWQTGLNGTQDWTAFYDGISRNLALTGTPSTFAQLWGNADAANGDLSARFGYPYTLGVPSGDFDLTQFHSAALFNNHALFSPVVVKDQSRLEMEPVVASEEREPIVLARAEPADETLRDIASVEPFQRSGQHYSRVTYNDGTKVDLSTGRLNDKCNWTGTWRDEANGRAVHAFRVVSDPRNRTRYVAHEMQNNQLQTLANFAARRCQTTVLAAR